MITAEVGFMLKVMGSKREMPTTGPIPGRTPIAVPSKDPMKQKKIFCQVRAWLKPRLKFAKRSTPLLPLLHQFSLLKK